jgi:hypothetical protein
MNVYLTIIKKTVAVVEKGGIIKGCASSVSFSLPVQRGFLYNGLKNVMEDFKA